MDSGNKRIAKNAGMLYVRMFLSTLVGLYTSRVVLQVLGVEDYGIYGLVGGVIGMIGFIQSSMSGATSRFITYELGSGNNERLSQIFSCSLIIHSGIAIIFLIFGETLGLWFLNNKLVIPQERIYAAHWVYQLSIVSSMIGVTQTPYGAVLMSHEKMDIYAYFELLNVFLKLGIVFVLVIGNFDKLILYAWLMFAVTVFMMFLYRFYCIRHFPESHFHLIWRKDIIQSLLSFSGWDLYGNMCVVTNRQSINFIINFFFGVLLNAASSVASTIHGTILGFSSVFVIAFRPQIIKNFAQQRYERMQDIMCNSIKYTIILYSAMAVPAMLEIDLVLKLWLETVPNYASIFCRILIFTSIIIFASNITLSAIHATGNIKRISFITGSVYLITIPIMYFILKFWHCNPEIVYIINFISLCFVLICNLSVLKIQIPQLSLWLLIKSLILGLLYPFLALSFFFPIYHCLDSSIIRLLMTCLIYPFLLLLITYNFALDIYSREAFKSYVRKRLINFGFRL